MQRASSNSRSKYRLQRSLSHFAAVPSGHCREAQELTLLLQFATRPQSGEARRAGGRAPTQCPAPFLCRAPVSILWCVSFLFYRVPLPSFSFLPYPGGGGQSLGRPDAVSLESTEEGACFTVAGQTMESSHRPAADFTFRVTKDGTPAPRNSMHRGPSAPRPPGAQVHTVPRSLEDQGL